jgi:hypothetical protein
MKKGFVFALLLTVFVVNVGFAGSADLEGSWTGTGEAVVPFNPFDPVGSGPTFLPNIVLCGEIIEQDGSLLWGVFVFLIPDPDENEDPIQVEAFVTGNVSTNKRIQAIISNPSLPELPIGTGIIDGKWNGKTISGVARDFTDGSTTYFEVKRGECPIED